MHRPRAGWLSDLLTRRRSRRTAVGIVGAGAVLATPLGRATARATAGPATCILEIEITARLGPSVDDQAEALVLTGELRLPLDDRGRVDDGVLLLDDDDEEFAVVGQIDGRAISLVVEIGRRERLTLVGVGEELLADCRGEIGGPATGPARGDLGDWRAIARELVAGDAAAAIDGSADAGGSGGGGSDPAPTPDGCPPETCGQPFAWDADACACTCAWTGGDPTPCYGECCDPGFVCTDAGCQCPAGTEFCQGGCATACQAGWQMEYDGCTCYEL